MRRRNCLPPTLARSHIGKAGKIEQKETEEDPVFAPPKAEFLAGTLAHRRTGRNEQKLTKETKKDPVCHRRRRNSWPARSHIGEAGESEQQETKGTKGTKGGHLSSAAGQCPVKFQFFFVSFVSFCKYFFMHPLYSKADELSRSAIGAAIEVHRILGPGLIESIYERCMIQELYLGKITTVNQRVIRIEYKGLVFEEPLRFDVLVEGCLLLELKCVKEIVPIHKAQLLSYMKLLDIPVGLLINFHEMRLVDGIVRLILPGANR